MAQSNGDIPRDVSKLTVPEAAKALGISPEAVRNRLSRSTLDSVKEKGRVFVLIDRDMARHTDDIPPDLSAVTEAKDETIRILREQLEAERTASAELRRIVAGLVQRVPELEPVREDQDTSQDASDTPGGEEYRSTQGGQEEPMSRRSWWRRIFQG